MDSHAKQPLWDATKPLADTLENKLSLFEISDNCFSKKKFDNDYVDITKIQFNAWIPNNSGLLRWELSAIDKPNRIVISKRNCAQAGQKHPTIECIDYNLAINDDTPDFFQNLRELVSFVRDRNKQGDLRLASKVRYLVDNTFSLRTKEVLLTNISFVDQSTGERIKIGKGHKTSSAAYQGSAMLLSYPKSEYKKLRLTNIKKRLNLLYSQGRDYLCSDIHNVEKEMAAMLHFNLPIYAYHIQFTVNEKGVITFEPIHLLHNSSAFLYANLKNYCGMEGYRHVLQLLYGQIKNVFHGDNHHHRKDDIILRVYPKGSTPTIVLDQIASHLKLLENIETSRKNIPCQKYVPSYGFDASGIKGYAQRYFDHAIKNHQDSKIVESGKNFLSAIGTLANSVNAQYARFNEMENKKKDNNLHGHGFRNPGIWILIFGFITLMYNLSATKGGMNDGLSSILSKNITCFFSVINIPFAIALFLMLIIYVNFGLIHHQYCCVMHLHKDCRPKDTKIVRNINPNTIKRLLRISIYIVIITIVIWLLSLTPESDAVMDSFVGMKDAFSNCQLFKE